MLGLGLGAALLYLALSNVAFDKLAAALQQVRYSYIVFPAACTLAAHGLRAYRWRMMVSAAGERTTTLRALASLMVGYTANYAVPRLGEVTRCTLLARTSGVPFATAIGTVVTERILDVLVLGLLILSLFAIEAQTLAGMLQQVPLLNKLPGWPLLLGVVVVLGVGAWALWRLWPRLMQVGFLKPVLIFAEKLWQGVLSIRNVRSPLLFIALTLGIWIFYWLSLYTTFWLMPDTANENLYFAYVLNILGAIGMAVPVPGGLGSFHNAIIAGFVAFSLNAETGAIFALLSHGFQMLFNIILGGLGYLYLLIMPVQPESKKG